jgi:hypothetical protein
MIRFAILGLGNEQERRRIYTSWHHEGGGFSEEDLYITASRGRRIERGGFIHHGITREEDSATPVAVWCASERLSMSHVSVVVCTTALGLDSWVEVLYTLIDQDMYSLILHIGRIPDIDMSSEAYAQPHLAPIPLPLLTVFSNLREGDNLLAVDVNLFQRALLMGRFKAACALAVICPDLLSRKLGIVSPEGTKCCISTSIMVKLLCKIAPWEENDACFRIPALADWQRRRSTSTTSLLSHQRQSRRGSLRLVQMQMYSSTNGNKMQ